MVTGCSDELIGRFETTLRELTQGPSAANEYPVSAVLLLFHLLHLICFYTTSNQLISFKCSCVQRKLKLKLLCGFLSYIHGEA